MGPEKAEEEGERFGGLDGMSDAELRDLLAGDDDE